MGRLAQTLGLAISKFCYPTLTKNKKSKTVSATVLLGKLQRLAAQTGVNAG